MKTILIFQLSRLRNAEFYQLINRILMLFNSSFVQSFGFTRLLNVLKGLYNLLEDAFLNNKTNPLTPEMKNADKRRDNFVIGINQAIGNFARIGNEAEVAASLALQPVIQPYKRAYNLSMVENSAQVRAYIFDLSSPANLPHIQTLKLADKISELENANEEFDDLFFARTENKENSETFEQLRKEITPALHAVFNRLNALYNIAEEDGEAEKAQELGEQIDRVNIIITEIQNTVDRRETRRKNAKEKKESEVGEDTKED